MRRETPPEFISEEVLDAAVDFFWKQGSRRCRTIDLESALGHRESSIYQVFGSRQGLMNAALTRYEELTARLLVEPLESSRAGLGSIDEFFVGLADWVTHDGRRGCMLVNLTIEDGGASAGLTERATACRRRVRAALHGALYRAATCGEMSDAKVDDRTDLLLGLVMGLNIAARGGAADGEVAQLLQGVRSQLRSWRTSASA